MSDFDARCEDACSCGCVIAAACSGAPQLKTVSTNLSWRENSKLASALSPYISHTEPVHVMSDEATLQGGHLLHWDFIGVGGWGGFPRTATSPNSSEDCCEHTSSLMIFGGQPWCIVWVWKLREPFCQVCITRQETEQTVTLCVSCLEAGLSPAPSNSEPKSLTCPVWALLYKHHGAATTARRETVSSSTNSL